jgi:hypothetical protein
VDTTGPPGRPAHTITQHPAPSTQHPAPSTADSQAPSIADSPALSPSGGVRTAEQPIRQ